MIANTDWGHDYNRMAVNKDEIARLLSRRISAAIIQTLFSGEIYTDLLLYRLVNMLGLKVKESAYDNLKEGNPIVAEDIIEMEPRIRYTSVIPLQEGYSYYNRGYRSARYIIATKELAEVNSTMVNLKADLEKIKHCDPADRQTNLRKHMLKDMISWCTTTETTYGTERDKFEEDLREIEKKEAMLRQSAGESRGAERDEFNKRADEAAAGKRELKPPTSLTEKELSDKIMECCRLFDLADNCFGLALEESTKSATIISYRSLTLFMKAKLMHILGRNEERDALLNEAITVFDDVGKDSPNYLYVFARKHEIYKWRCLHELDEKKRLAYYEMIDECKKKVTFLSETWFFDGSLSSDVDKLLEAAMTKYKRACLFRTSETTAGSFVLSYYNIDTLVRANEKTLKDYSKVIRHLPILTDLAGNYYIQIGKTPRTFKSFQDILNYLRENHFHLCSKKDGL